MLIKQSLFKVVATAFIFVLSSLFVTSSVYAKSFGQKRNGTISCIGSFNFSGTQETRIGIRNRNHDASLKVEAIRVYDVDGNLVYNSDTDGFIAGIKTSLPPHNSTRGISMSDLAAAGSGTWTGGPGMMEFDWKTQGKAKAIPLSVGAFRRVRDGSGNIVAERPQNCEIIPSEK